jgi:hypothetical protein
MNLRPAQVWPILERSLNQQARPGRPSIFSDAEGVYQSEK